jgi:hypothetical protein
MSTIFNIKTKQNQIENDETKKKNLKKSKHKTDQSK